jgi:hypothetical protein
MELRIRWRLVSAFENTERLADFLADGFEPIAVVCATAVTLPGAPNKVYLRRAW